MTYSVNQKINTGVQPSMGVNTPLSGVTAPQLQNIDLHQDVVQNSALRGVAGGSKDKPWMMPAIILPTWAAMAYGMEKFNKACRGNYQESLVGKVQAWAEKIGESNFFKSKPMVWLENKFVGGNKWFKEKAIPKSKILTAMFTTPSEPNNPMVKMMKDSTFGEVRADAIQKLGEYVKDGTDVENLKKLGLTADEFKAIKTDPRNFKNTQKLLEVCRNAGDQSTKMQNMFKLPKFLAKNGNPRYLTDFAPWLSKVFGREVQFTEYANKLQALDNGSKNWVGKKVPKMMLRLIEGITNGTAGGKIAIFLGAIFVADAIKKTIEAPKGHGEKRKTFIEEFVYNEAMYLTMPLGLGIMHGAGGLQYIGVSKENVEKFRAEQKIFNEKVKAGAITDKKAYSAEIKRIKEFLKPEYAKTKGGKIAKGILYKPLSWAAKVLTVGLENFAPFNPKGITKETAGFMARAGQWLQHGKARGFKWAAGGPMRFMAYLMVIAPFLGKAAVSVSNSIFGRPAKSVLDDEPEGPPEPQPGHEIGPMTNQPTQPVAIQPTSQAPQTLPSSQATMQPIQSNSSAGYVEYPRENLLAAYKANQMSQAGMMPANSPTRNYIPSDEPVRLQKTQRDEQQDAVAGAAVSRADRAEMNASKYLGKGH